MFFLQLIGALSGSDSIIVTLRACSSVPVFKRPGIILVCALVMSYTLKEKAGKWHETSDIVAETSACVENYMKNFGTVFLHDFSSFVCVRPDMMFTSVLNRTSNNQISRDCRIESGVRCK